RREGKREGEAIEEASIYETLPARARMSVTRLGRSSVVNMHDKLVAPPLDAVLGSASAVAAGRLAGAGPAGRLPLTPDMLREEPSGNVFGLTQNVGMGWSPASLDGPQYVIVSTHGGL